MIQHWACSLEQCVLYLGIMTCYSELQPVWTKFHCDVHLNKSWISEAGECIYIHTKFWRRASSELPVHICRTILQRFDGRSQFKVKCFAFLGTHFSLSSIRLWPQAWVLQHIWIKGMCSQAGPWQSTRGSQHVLLHFCGDFNGHVI